jgi:hypothetical protein
LCDQPAAVLEPIIGIARREPLCARENARIAHRNISRFSMAVIVQRQACGKWGIKIVARSQMPTKGGMFTLRERRSSAMMKSMLP